MPLHEVSKRLHAVRIIPETLIEQLDGPGLVLVLLPALGKQIVLHGDHLGVDRVPLRRAQIILQNILAELELLVPDQSLGREDHVVVVFLQEAVFVEHQVNFFVVAVHEETLAYLVNY